MMTTTTAALSSPAAVRARSISLFSGSTRVSSLPIFVSSLSKIEITSKSCGGRRRRISCEVATSTPISASSSSSSSSSSSKEEGEEELLNELTGGRKIGARVRVNVPLKVYHVPKVPEVDLTGMEGELKQFVGLWKGKRISANLPYKIQFVTDIPGRGPVKFFAHLKDDEFEILD